MCGAKYHENRSESIMIISNLPKRKWMYEIEKKTQTPKFGTETCTHLHAINSNIIYVKAPIVSFVVIAYIHTFVRTLLSMVVVKCWPALQMRFYLISLHFNFSTQFFCFSLFLPPLLLSLVFAFLLYTHTQKHTKHWHDSLNCMVLLMWMWMWILHSIEEYAYTIQYTCTNTWYNTSKTTACVSDRPIKELFSKMFAPFQSN